MTEVGTNYGGALYALAKDENLGSQIHQQLQTLQESFRQEPDFGKLLAMPALAKAERCQILESSFRDKVHPYVLNFLKILTEKGYIRYFSDCCDAYTALYYGDNGILPVTAVTAVAMTAAQEKTLQEKLQAITGKQVLLHSRIDPTVLGGIRLSYSGQRLDDTISHRLESLGAMLNNTVL